MTDLGIGLVLPLLPGFWDFSSYSVMTPGQVAEKGRTQVAGAGFDRWGTQTRVLAQPQRADL